MKLKSVTSLAKRLLLSTIGLYRVFSAIRPPCCRFYPSCSKFMHAAISKHGMLVGLSLGCMRLLRCHPLHPGGVDEVPESLGFRPQLLERCGALPSKLFALVPGSGKDCVGT